MYVFIVIVILNGTFVWFWAVTGEKKVRLGSIKGRFKFIRFWEIKGRKKTDDEVKKSIKITKTMKYTMKSVKNRDQTMRKTTKHQ